MVIFDSYRVGGICAESVGILSIGVCGYAAAVFGAKEGYRIECAEPHSDFKVRRNGPDARDDLAKKPGAVLEASAITSRARDGAQELVTEVTVAVLDIHKVEPDVGSALAARDEIIHQPGNLGVGHARIIRRNAKSRVEHRMVIEDGRLDLRLLVGPRKPPGVGQLKADQKVVRRAEAALVLLDERRSQGRDRGFRAVEEQELVGIRASIVAHRNRLASPDQLGAALPEAPPATQGEVGRLALPGPVPAFHRENAEPVSDSPAVERAGTGQWRLGACF